MADEETKHEITPPMDMWGLVRVADHYSWAGHVTEQHVAGARFIRVDVPAIPGRAAFVKLLAVSTVDAITSLDEDEARKLASTSAPTGGADLRTRAIAS